MSAEAVDAVSLSEALPSGNRRSVFSVPGIRCGGCVAAIEKTLGDLDNVSSVRANLTLKRVRVDWNPHTGVDVVLQALKNLGFDVSVVSESDSPSDLLGKRYIRATAVAGFAAGNIMMLSVAVWAGADRATQLLFHSLSALLAVAAVVYSGSIFFESAWRAISKRRTNMDVPISVGIILSMGLGLYDTYHGGSEVYFEAATMLIFFLLIGRTLDHVMRQRAESSIGQLARLTPRTTLVLVENGPATVDAETIRVEVSSVDVGQNLLIPTNSRIPLDAVIVTGTSEFDTSIVNGESLPKVFCEGETLEAGILNLGPPVVAQVCRSAEHSFLSRTQRLVESVSLTSGRYQTLSERVARWYAPFVHLAALSAGLLWSLNGSDIHTAITVAIAVLIITCPCALGLAVPMVQVLAGARLYKNGVVMKNGDALERLSEINSIVFDKTGTLTQKTATVKSMPSTDIYPRDILYALAQQSSHPFAQSIAKNMMVSRRQHGDCHPEGMALKNVSEYPGLGIEGTYEGVLYRLGKLSWVKRSTRIDSDNISQSESGFSADGVLLVSFRFGEILRDDALMAVQSLRTDGCFLCIASGDEAASVESIASALQIKTVLSNASPAQKSALIQSLQADGNSVLMVGDGINDTVAQAAANVSFAMGDAGDIAATNADFVLMQNRLSSITGARRLAVAADKLVRQNIFIAIAYNVFAMPLAFAGWVSPLVAAVAMSASSLVVVGNSLRLNRKSMWSSNIEQPMKLDRSALSTPLSVGQA